MFFNVCLRSRSFSLRADWQKSDSSVDEESQGPSCKLSYLFPPRHQSAPKSLLAGYYRELVSTCPCVPDRVEFWKCWFFLGQGKTRVPREKPLGARERHNNKLKPHMASTLGFEPGSHWRETSALTTAPPLFSNVSVNSKSNLKQKKMHLQKSTLVGSSVRRYWRALDSETRTITSKRFSQSWVLLTREPASFWRENVIAVVILLRVLARMSSWWEQVFKCKTFCFQERA